MTARDWLLENGYPDVVELIDDATEQWKAKGAKTRRNWWQVLAGGRDGKPRVIAGITFPVLAAAQMHEGLPVTPNAERRNPEEQPPDKSAHGLSLTRARQEQQAQQTTSSVG